MRFLRYKKYLNWNLNVIFLSSLVLAASFFITACDNSSTITNYHLGTKGASLEKLNTNPEIIYEGETIGLGILLKNEGAANINEGLLRVNYDDFFFSLEDEINNSKKRYFSLEGKSLESPLGGSDYIEYVFTAKTLEVIRTGVDTTVNFNICYPYVTDLTTEVCIDTRTRTGDTSHTVCKASPYTSSTGQGAPITISKIEPEMLVTGDDVRPLFRIYIQNVGKGYTLTPEKDICEDPTKNASKLNMLKVNAWISDNKELECNPSNIRLIDGAAIARCYVKDSDLNSFSKKTSNYISALRVKLEYNYVDSETIKINIKRVNEIDIRSMTLCGYYEKEYDGECISLCDFCIKNPNDDACSRNNPDGITLTADFGCVCDEQKCLTLSKDGKCLFGYCNGNSYCCSTDECREKADGTKCADHNVCINKRCMLNTTLCDYTFGIQNYSCNNINSCNQTTIKNEYCPGDDTNVCCKT